MKTAEEILKDHSNVMIDDIEDITDAMKEYAREACREQRHICQIEMDKDSVQMKGKFYVSCEDVLNSPEPELK